MRRPALILAYLGAALALAAPAGAQTLARTAAPYDTQSVSIDTWGGTTVYSQFDATTSTYALAAIRGTDAPELLPVAPQAVPFDLDVGPGPDGRPALVYPRCSRLDGVAPAGCDVYRYSFATRTEAPIAGVNTGFEEFAPTIWKHTIAFARTRVPGLTVKQLARVYTRELDAPAARSRPQPVMPARVCHGSDRCRRITYGTVEELELRGNRLAAVVRTGPPTGDAMNPVVRLVDGKDARTVAATEVGAISVRKEFFGLSFEGARLSFGRSFFYSRPDGVYRYDIRTRRMAAAPLPRTTYGLAALGGDRYLRLGTCVPGCPAIPLPPGSTPFAPGPFALELTRTAALHFAPARAPS